MSEDNIAIKTQDIVKDYISGDTTIRVLHGINLEIPRGELAMLVGPSGCGKTTLISILSGILNPTGGEVWVNGNNITHFDDYHKVIFRRKHIGFIFQQYNLLPSLTAAENAAIPLIVSGTDYDQAIAKAKEILVQIGMGEAVNKQPRHLSGGQQQRVAIARALVHKPNVVICDEPTAALDAHTGKVVMEILADIAKNQQCTLIVVTHDNRIIHFADRIFEMEDGRIIKETNGQGASNEI